MSMSLDGFVTAANPRMEEPTGDGGQVLTEWAMGDENGLNSSIAMADHMWAVPPWMGPWDGSFFERTSSYLQ
jgi:hypothetical protein